MCSYTCVSVCVCLVNKPPSPFILSLSLSLSTQLSCAQVSGQAQASLSATDCNYTPSQLWPETHRQNTYVIELTKTPGLTIIPRRQTEDRGWFGGLRGKITRSSGTSATSAGDMDAATYEMLVLMSLPVAWTWFWLQLTEEAQTQIGL